MTIFFACDRKALLRIAGIAAIFGIAAQYPLSAQSPTEPYPFEAQAPEDQPNSSGVSAPLRFTASHIMLTGDGQMGSIPAQAATEIATDGRGGKPEDAWDFIEPDLIPDFGFVP